MRKYIAAFLATFMLTGCVLMEEPKPEGYYQDLRVRYDESRTKTYQGVETEAVLKAMATMFELADPDYKVIYGRKGLIAYREASMELMLVDGKPSYWYATVYPFNTGVTVRVRCVQQADPFTSLDPEVLKRQPGALVSPETMDPRETMPQELEESFARHMILFKRLDYLLGRNNFWLYCRAAEEYVRMEKQPGDLDPFCLQTADAKPGGVVVR